MRCRRSKIGNILANEVTVEECVFDKNDYITLIRNPLKKDNGGEMTGDTISESSIENSGQLSRDTSNFTQASDDNDQSSEKEEQSISEKIWSKEVTDLSFNSSDSESDELSRNELLESIPNFKSLCSIVKNNPVELPKMLSRHGPLLFEKILENQHAFMDLLDTENTNSVMKEPETKDHEAIDRLVEKGFEKDFAIQAYQACGSNESGAADLLLALKID